MLPHLQNVLESWTKKQKACKKNNGLISWNNKCQCDRIPTGEVMTCSWPLHSPPWRGTNVTRYESTLARGTVQWTMEDVAVMSEKRMPRGAPRPDRIWRGIAGQRRERHKEGIIITILDNYESLGISGHNPLKQRVGSNHLTACH